jgi:hypothetical protein
MAHPFSAMMQTSQEVSTTNSTLIYAVMDFRYGESTIVISLKGIYTMSSLNHGQNFSSMFS